MTYRSILTWMLGLGLYVCTSAGALAQKPDLHQDWDKLLKTNWKEAKLPYARLKAKPAVLDGYLKKMAAVHAGRLKSREDKLAYWINLYNACTLRVILDSYPLQSGSKVDQISLKGPQGEAWSIWQKPFCQGGGKTWTLDQIEKEILLGELKEPLVHFAINCGALSCPNLRAEAYQPRRVIAQMEEQARKFLADTSRNQFDRDRKTIRLSMIFGWYGEDFQRAAEGNLVKYLQRYVTPDLRQWITDPQLSIDYLEYDWTLNDLEPKG